MRRELLWDAAFLFLISAVVGFVFNAFSPDGLSLIRVNPEKIPVPDSVIFGGTQGGAGDAVAGDPDSPDTLRIITLDQLRRIIDRKMGMIIDARTPDEYAEGHIGGSVNMYALEPGSYFDRIVDIPRDSLMVVYCSNPECHFARTVAEFLTDFGFSNVVLYDDGWDGWTDAGMPAESGEEAGR